MALTAREWLLLPQEEAELRKSELSAEECAKLRLELDMIHFTEDEKRKMSAEQKYQFIHPKERTAQEKADFNQKAAEIFRMMQKE